MDIILKLEDRGPHCILKKETIGRYTLNLLHFFVVFLSMFLFLFPIVLFLKIDFGFLFIEIVYLR